MFYTSFCFRSRDEWTRIQPTELKTKSERERSSRSTGILFFFNSIAQKKFFTNLMVLDIAKYKPNRIVFHDFDVCAVFFLLFYCPFDYFWVKFDENKNHFYSKIITFALVKVFFVLFWTEKFPTKERASHIYGHRIRHKYDALWWRLWNKIKDGVAHLIATIKCRSNSKNCGGFEMD